MNYLSPAVISRNFIEEGNGQLTRKDQARLLGISRSSLYYQPRPIDSETLDLLNKVDKIHTDWPDYGARKIRAKLFRDYKINIGRKRARSLMEDLCIEAVYQKPHLSQNNKPHPVFPYLLKGVPILRSNHVWGTDITYIRLKGSYCYLTCFLDWHSRFVVSWKLSTTLETRFVLEAAKEALTIGIPEIVNSDQGAQYSDHRYISLWNPERTKISMDHRGRCFDNIFTERFWRTLKYAEVYLKDYQSVWEAEKSISAYITRYNYEYLHESLGYKTPAEVYFVN